MVLYGRVEGRDGVQGGKDSVVWWVMEFILRGVGGGGVGIWPS